MEKIYNVKNYYLDLMMIANKFVIKKKSLTTDFWKGAAYNKPSNLLLFITLTW